MPLCAESAPLTAGTGEQWSQGAALRQARIETLIQTRLTALAPWQHAAPVARWMGSDLGHAQRLQECPPGQSSSTAAEGAAANVSSIAAILAKHGWRIFVPAGSWGRKDWDGKGTVYAA